MKLPAAHLLVAGSNGTGKTSAVRELVRPVQGLAVLDTKRVGDYAGLAPETEDVRDVLRLDRLVYLAPPGAPREALEEFYRLCYLRGSVVVVVDELKHSVTAAYIGLQHRAIMVSGRGRHIVAVSLTQRYVGTHNDVLSESWYHLLFGLPQGEVAKMAEYMPRTVALTAAELPKYAWRLYGREERRILGAGRTSGPTGQARRRGATANRSGGRGRESIARDLS